VTEEAELFPGELHRHIVLEEKLVPVGHVADPVERLLVLPDVLLLLLAQSLEPARTRLPLLDLIMLGFNR
jgi:hypothetical protein